MNAKRRQELKFQDHIIESYKRQGGYARKWATDLQVGLPDLCATHPAFGGHWCEVKHRPEWVAGTEYKNPLDGMQVRNARLFIEGGALVYGAVIVGSTSALKSRLVVFHPLALSMQVTERNSFDYMPGKGYDMRAVLQERLCAPPF